MLASFDTASDREGAFLWVFAETEAGLFLLNETMDGENASLMSVTEENERYTFTPAGKTACSIDGCTLTLTAEKSALGLKPGGTLKLRVIDSRDPGESPADFYDHGDCLPLGRVWYAAVME